jgi:hypothetical protein
VFVGKGAVEVVIVAVVPFLEAVALGAKVVVPWLPTSTVTVPDVVVYTSVAFLVTVPERVFESVDKVTVVVTEGYVTDPVAPSMLRGSTVPEMVTIAVVSVSEAEVVEDEDDVVVDWAKAPVNRATAIHSERILLS